MSKRNFYDAEHLFLSNMEDRAGPFGPKIKPIFLLFRVDNDNFNSFFVSKLT